MSGSNGSASDPYDFKRVVEHGVPLCRIFKGGNSDTTIAMCTDSFVGEVVDALNLLDSSSKETGEGDCIETPQEALSRIFGVACDISSDDEGDATPS